MPGEEKEALTSTTNDIYSSGDLEQQSLAPTLTAADALDSFVLTNTPA
jgi:hypothetical protein